MKIITYLLYAIIFAIAIIWLEYCIPGVIGQTIKATRMKNKCICTQEQAQSLRDSGAEEDVIKAACERITD